MKLDGPNSVEIDMPKAVASLCMVQDIKPNEMPLAEFNLATKFLEEMPNYYLKDEDIDYACRVVFNEVYNAIVDIKGEASISDIQNGFEKTLRDYVSKPNNSQQNVNRVLNIGKRLYQNYNQQGIKGVYYWNADPTNYRYEQLETLKMQALNGNQQAMRNLGSYYIDHNNDSEAMYWYTRLVEMYEDPYAYVNLGILNIRDYYRNANEAGKWLSRAVNSGNEECRAKAQEIINGYLKPKFFGGWKFL